MSADPVRTLELLWRDALGTPSEPARGPRRGLDLDDVLAAAERIADAEGLDALTMRALANAVGVAPMTLYTYVAGRDELLELLLDAAYAGMTRTDTTGRPWPERVRAVAEENRAWHRAHPWTVRMDPSRPVLGPGETAKYEHELAAFDELAELSSLDDVERDAALTFVLDFVRAAARAEHEGDRGDAGQWWAARAPVLSRVLDPDRFPRACRVGSAAGAAQGSARDPEHAWRFGLARVLDGLEVLARSPQ